MVKNGKNILCKYCKQPFYVAQWQTKYGRKFCSNKCRFGIGLEKVKCSVCNKEFTAHKSAERKTCSYICRNKTIWKGGKVKNGQGYFVIYSPGRYKGHNYIPEHRLVIKKHLGRKLKPSEHVHHINGNRRDNRIENLILFSSGNEHIKYHWNTSWKHRRVDTPNH